jgi:amino acid adenylation domain-containing protein
VPPFEGALLCVDTAELAGEPSENPQADAQSNNLAYVMYTSGSTGTPKGVMIEHRAICRLVKGADYADFGADQVFLQLAPISFDASTFEIWGSLLNGARLAIFPPEPPTNENLAATVRREGVTTLWLTAALFHHVAAEAPSTFTGLKQLLAGGDVLAIDHVRTAVGALASGHFVNGYGPTETTTFACCHHITAATELADSVPIGRPIANTEIYILDPRRQPVPIGVPGELYIGGPGLARGYLNRPELTAERFVAHPFNTSPGARLYRTGDRVRYRPDGTIDFLGRFDDQVKVRGFRVEPGEIEAALLAHPAVREAALVARREPDGDQRLLAYFVANAQPPTTTALRAFLAERLPNHMLPTAAIAVEQLPRTANGKLDRDALPEPAERPELEQGYVEPRTDLERALAEIWQQLLRLDRIGINDDFFELGGHSLLAVRLFAEIERKLGARLPLSTLFETATIAGLAEAIELGHRERRAWPSLVTLRPGTEAERPLFLVAWAGGEVLPYRDLAENLDPNVPVLGLRSPGTDRRELPLATVEQLAEHFVEELRGVQPRGPYRLGGFCFSGLVAYEMARQLQKAGEAIDLLALIDAYPYRPLRRRGIVQTGRIQLKALKHADRVGRRDWLRNRIAGLRGRAHHAVYYRLGPALFERLDARELTHLLPCRPWNLVLIASELARKRYVPTSLDVRVTFFRAQRAPHSRPTPWDRLATRGVELRPIVAAGITHESMMREPDVKLLAEQLMRELEPEAQNTSRAHTGHGAPTETPSTDLLVRGAG